MYPTSNLSIKEGGILKVPLAKLGKWFHKIYGVVQFTEQDFDDIIKNFRNNLLGHTPYLTFGHEKENNLSSIDADRKHGDMIGFTQEEDTLFGLFKASTEAYNDVMSGKYDFSSGEFIREFLDKNSGENKGTTLMRVALTNSPFIPNFKTVQALSQNNEDSNIVFTMSLNMENQEPITTTENPQDLSINNQDSSSESIQSIESIDTKKEEDIPTNTIETLSNITSEEVIKKTINKEREIEKKEIVNMNEPIPYNANSFSVDGLVEDISSKIEKKYERTLHNLEILVQDLQNQIIEKDKVLQKTASLNQAQAYSLSKAQEEVLKAQEKVTEDYLIGEGVSPVLIQKFSQLREAIISNNSVIKLSEGGVDKEITLVQALSNLLVDAVNTPSISFDQIGSSTSIYQDPTGLLSVAEATIRRNNQLIRERQQNK